MTQEDKKPNNPSAFAMGFCNEQSLFSQEGMTLRDYFANSAMQGMLATYNDQTSFDTFKHSANDLATTSYIIADAMLKQRDL